MLWIKAFHIISVVTWFAGLLYLPRLFVYHADVKDEVSHERFIVMERRLYKGIMTPSVAVVFFLGLMLFGYNHSYYLASVWFHVKVALAVALLIYHIRCGYYMRRLANKDSIPSSHFFRWFNEVPAVILIIVVVLVEVQPVL